MTVLTARGYPRFREAIARNPELRIAETLPVALENGARIIRHDGRQLCYRELTSDQLEAADSYIRSARGLRYVAFHSKALHRKTLLWASPSEASRLTVAYSHNADVFTGSFDKLKRAIRSARPCMITCRLTDRCRPAPGPQDLTSFTTGAVINMLASGADKGHAAQIMLDIARIPQQRVLAAGNDIPDLPMLRLPDLGLPAAIGPALSAKRRELPASTVYLADPALLADLISQVTATSDAR